MTRFALSTMFAQHPRFDDGAAFARFAADAGYDAIEISHSTPGDKVRAILAADVLPVVSVHQPAPWATTSSGIANTDLNLAALDEVDRSEAVAWAVRSIHLASEVGARAVVLHLGHVGSGPSFAGDNVLRERYAVAGINHDDCAALLAMRSSTAGPYLAAARRSLIELASRASIAGIVLGVESRLSLHEIPLPSELPFLLHGLDPMLAGYWHDVGHVEVLHRLGYVDREAWFNQPDVSVAGAHVHDVAGIVDHRAPGRGDVDLAWHLARVAHIETLTLEINQFEPDNAVMASPSFLRDRFSPRN